MIKPRRSALYMPCSNTRALEKAQVLAADVLLFDLEDAVAPDKKLEARENIVQALEVNDYGSRERIVRINHGVSEWGKLDLEAIKNSDFDGLLLPKVESPQEIYQVLSILGADVEIWVMIETPKGVLNAEAIAAHDNVKVLVLGTNDLAKELRVQQSAPRQEFFYAFSQCIMAARAHGCDVLDGVYNQLDDEQGLVDICQQGKMLGFDGKTLIHPKQLQAANDVFRPSLDEVEEAKTIINAWQQSDDKGVLVVNGRLVEELHVESAQRVVEIDQAIET